MMVWLKPLLIVLGFLAYSIVIWFAGPLIGFGSARPFDPVWVRLLMIGIFALILLVWAAIKLLQRRKGQNALEKALVADAPAGDGEVLAERMQAALGTLKTTGRSRTYLYDLPWYIIIGPPGSGKTTALMNADIKFPLAEQKKDGVAQGAMTGFGGTRYCDWWFGEDAILIDTAGRYTTQDSGGSGDKTSWMSFLSLLKKNRPKQPINGVILAFSVADLMNASAEEVAGHAKTVRARLSEIHETLKIDFPVYVMFTKADLISGFREYFASFSMTRRKRVWGATFQTSNPADKTYDRVVPEFDALVSRLAEEVMDRLTEEPDGVNRIAIFGLPGQMAMLRDTIADFLRQVFEPTRYKSNAILRGFYFTSGTQEGTPIDQVLGAMGRSFGSDQFAFLSGKGKSFFLNELLTKVIFGEQGWVSYDRKAVRRATLTRLLTVTALLLATVGLLSLWGLSYWNNRALVADSQSALADYETAAAEDVQATEISETDLLRVAGHLNILRGMPAGYEAPIVKASWTETTGFGLSQRSQIAAAGRAAYRDGLERLLRPRLVLRVEEKLQALQANSATNQLEIYETLKVYKLIGGLAPAPGAEDGLIQSWFQLDWEDVSYPGEIQAPARAQLAGHLAALLELDGETEFSVTLNGDLIRESEAILARLPLEDRAWSLIVATSDFNDVPGFSLVGGEGTRAGEAALVFQTIDGSDLSTLSVPALYTHAGFNNYFLDKLGAIGEQLASEQWVMGDGGKAANIDVQLATLGPRLMDRYTREFEKAWLGMLGNLRLAPMSADKPNYEVLSAAAAASTSPILKLVEAVSEASRVTTAPATPPADEAGLEVSPEVLARLQTEIQYRLSSRTSGWSRIGLPFAASKGQTQAGGKPVALPGQDIEDSFAEYHQLLEGGVGARVIDALLADLEAIRQALLVSGFSSQTQVAANMPALIGKLKGNVTRLPPDLERMVAGTVDEFEVDATNATISQINEALVATVSGRCTDIVNNRFPFGGEVTRQVPMGEFAEVFGYDGLLDKFFVTHLATHVDMSGREWSWLPNSPLAEKASLTTLRQFQNASSIRDAFFPGRSPTVSLNVTFVVSKAHQKVNSILLQVDGQQQPMRPQRGASHSFTWPATGGVTGLMLLPELKKRESQVAFEGAWGLLRFLRGGSPRQTGNILQVGYVIGGRDVGFDVKVDALENPFTLRELGEFKCPTGF
jgi:type VI secretion system protein ImpL